MSPAADRTTGSTRTAGVVGGGWAGLAAAVELCAAGWRVTVLEMSPQLGGRARTLERQGWTVDNGQHIMIGAYRQTLDLMRRVGLDPQALLERRPLALPDTQGRGLCLKPGPILARTAQAVLLQRHWPVTARLRFLLRAGSWLRPGADCDPSLTVARWTADLPAQVRREVIEPLCVSALNTTPEQASARMFMRVLRDALLGGAGSADLLLPTRPLGELLPDAAQRWLQVRGADVRLRSRAGFLAPSTGGDWQVDDSRFDAVVLACSPGEAARLVAPLDRMWSDTADRLPHAAILTVYVQWDGAALTHHPMARLEQGPAQFVFDHGRLSGRPGLLACVVSAAPTARPHESDSTLEHEVLAQLRRQFPPSQLGTGPQIVASILEKRATLHCTPGLQRPAQRIRPGLVAAGDHVEGPYPSTLEGAVRSGIAAARYLSETIRDRPMLSSCKT